MSEQSGLARRARCTPARSAPTMACSVAAAIAIAPSSGSGCSANCRVSVAARPGLRSVSPLAASACRIAAVFTPLNEKSYGCSVFAIGSGVIRAPRGAFAASAESAAPPGYGAPRRRAILSKASPAASSIVPPRRCMAPSCSIRTSNVCPPETTSPIAGSVGASTSAASRSHAARRCPSR